jgi:hypothetical protein
VDSFVLRHGDRLSERKSTPEEWARLKVPRALLNEKISCLREFVQGMKAEIVFNLNEVGMSD